MIRSRLAARCSNSLMTICWSGKTGLLMVLVEEALRASIPVVMIDVNGGRLLHEEPADVATDLDMHVVAVLDVVVRGEQQVEEARLAGVADELA